MICDHATTYRNECRVLVTVDELYRPLDIECQSDRQEATMLINYGHIVQSRGGEELTSDMSIPAERGTWRVSEGLSGNFTHLIASQSREQRQARGRRAAQSADRRSSGFVSAAVTPCHASPFLSVGRVSSQNHGNYTEILSGTYGHKRTKASRWRPGDRCGGSDIKSFFQGAWYLDRPG